MSELAKLENWRQDLALIETIEEIQFLRDSGEAYQKLMKKRGIAKNTQDKVGEFIIEIEEKEADWLNKFYPSRVNINKRAGSNSEPAKMPTTKKESTRARKLKKKKEEDPKAYEILKQEIKNSNTVLNPKALLNKISNIEKDTQIKEAQKQRAEIIQSKAPIIYHEDCIKFLGKFKDKSIDLLLTDPPYSTDIKDLPAFLDTWLYNALNKIKDTGRAFICIGAYPIELYTYLEYLLKTDWIIDPPLIWTYRNTLGQTPKMKYNLNYQVILHLYKKTSHPLDTAITNEMFSVQDINAPDGRLKDKFFKWQKPDELTKRFIIHATKLEDKIIDPFAGSGTFLIIASENDRLAWGCDTDLEVIKIAQKRGCEYKEI